jgi:hypothetical protein
MKRQRSFWQWQTPITTVAFRLKSLWLYTTDTRIWCRGLVRALLFHTSSPLACKFNVLSLLLVTGLLEKASRVAAAAGSDVKAQPSATTAAEAAAAKRSASKQAEEEEDEESAPAQDENEEEDEEEEEAVASHEEDDETDPNEVMYTLPLTADRSLELRASDLEGLILLQQSIGAAGTQRLLDVFSRFMNEDGRLDEVQFTRACEYLIPSTLALSDSKRHLLQFLLATMFSLFDDDGNGVIDCKEWLAGAVSLTALKHQDKLAVSFLIVDEDGDGYLQRKEVQDFIGAFLRVLMGVSQYARQSLTPAELQQLVSAAAQAHTEQLFARADLDHDDQLSFAEFQAVCCVVDMCPPFLPLCGPCCCDLNRSDLISCDVM